MGSSAGYLMVNDSNHSLLLLAALVSILACCLSPGLGTRTTVGERANSKKAKLKSLNMQLITLLTYSGSLVRQETLAVSWYKPYKLELA